MTLPSISKAALNSRRQLLAQLTALASGAVLPTASRAAAPQALRFTRDLGAHPDHKLEWWYITGHAATSAGREFGFQLTFFRSRVDAAQALKSAFAAKQLIFAHAAVTDLQGGKLWHDQRIARQGFDIASASAADTDLKLGDWTLQRSPGDGHRYQARLPAGDFSLALDFTATQPLLLQGQQGWSRKGPEERQASYYYSEPQLQTAGQITLRGQRFDVSGKAWLDHEWSNELLHPEARGWDWIGMNLDDGSALTAFQLRRADGRALWGGGSFRAAKGAASIFKTNDVAFQAVRWWTSPLTQARYPVEWQVKTTAGIFKVRALLDNQELDSRSSTGSVYWEGLSELLDVQGRRIGRGYLEMTGYAAPLRL